MLTSSVLREPPSLQVALAGRAAPVLALGLPLLGGMADDVVIPGAVFTGAFGHFAVFEAGPWLIAQATAPAGEQLSASVRTLYREMFGLLAGRQLARVWNYVPRINQPHAHGLETYHVFCRARGLAYQEEWGPTYQQCVPAASAVGTNGPDLCVVFAAIAGRGWNVENPFQVPAYRYPSEYGPVSPSFARATVVEAAAGRRHVFISGTAAIRGHATQALGDTPGQLECTVENLRVISSACGIGERLGGSEARHRSIKVYVRNAGDVSAVARVLEAELLVPGDRVSYVRADICRRDLNVEIEASILDAVTE